MMCLLFHDRVNKASSTQNSSAGDATTSTAMAMWQNAHKNSKKDDIIERLLKSLDSERTKTLQLRAKVTKLEQR